MLEEFVNRAGERRGVFVIVGCWLRRTGGESGHQGQGQGEPMVQLLGHSKVFRQNPVHR